MSGGLQVILLVIGQVSCTPRAMVVSVMYSPRPCGTQENRSLGHIALDV